MAIADKTRLLKAIIDKSDGFSRQGNNEEKDAEVFAQLKSNLLQHYKAEFLTTFLQHAVKQKYYWPNRFIKYLLSSSPIE